MIFGEYCSKFTPYCRGHSRVIVYMHTCIHCIHAACTFYLHILIVMYIPGIIYDNYNYNGNYNYHLYLTCMIHFLHFTFTVRYIGLHFMLIHSLHVFHVYFMNKFFVIELDVFSH